MASQWTTRRPGSLSKVLFTIPRHLDRRHRLHTYAFACRCVGHIHVPPPALRPTFFYIPDGHLKHNHLSAMARWGPPPPTLEDRKERAEAEAKKQTTADPATPATPATPAKSNKQLKKEAEAAKKAAAAAATPAPAPAQAAAHLA